MNAKWVRRAGNLFLWDRDLSRGQRKSLWEDCPLLAIQQDPKIGSIWMDDFHEYDATNNWTLTQATQGTGALSTTESNVLLLDSNSSTSTQGANLQRTGGPFIVPVAGKKIWYETRLKVTDTIDKVECFAGLAEVDTSIIATSAISTENHIGWYSVTDNGVLLFGANKATAAATKASHTLVEDTYVDLGFVVDGLTSIQQYINGEPYGAAHAAANVPAVKLVPSYVCQSAGTNDPIMSIDWVKIVELRA